MSKQTLNSKNPSPQDVSPEMHVLSTGISAETLRDADERQLRELQAQLMMGHTWGRWEVPAELMPGRHGMTHRRTYRVELALPKGMDPKSAPARAVWAELLRVTIAMRLFPSAHGTRKKFSSIHTDLRNLGLVTRRIALPAAPGFWSRATRAQFLEWLGDRSGRNVANLLGHLKRIGALGDAPVGRRLPKSKSGARDRTGEAEHRSSGVSTIQYQPFPDAYTASAGWHAIQMIQRVGPVLLDALEAAAKVPLRVTVHDPRSPRFGERLKGTSPARIKAQTLDPIIRNWIWTAPDGTNLETLPMSIHLKQQGGTPVHWPPRTHSEAWTLLTVLQASHLWPVALATAGRHGELISMVEDSIHRAETSTPTGQFPTWKLDGIAGREAEAPLPSLAIEALHQQKRLARLIKAAHGKEGGHLWVMTTKRPGLPLTSFASTLGALNRAFHLDPLLQGGSSHMHRFRKTLVRIVALALVHAPKILMDVLGHRDEQMTVMRYILSDPGILKEIEETTRELVVLKGVEAVQSRGALQGAAAPVLRERVAAYADRIGAKALEPQNLLEFVRAMTEGGTGWAIVAPGIICTGFKHGGLCNKGQGEANPHNCHPACHNQLVLPTYEEDGVRVTSAVLHAIETISYSLDRLREADVNGEHMLVAQFAGQVKTILGRWREVDQHFSVNADLRKYLPNVTLLS